MAHHHRGCYRAVDGRNYLALQLVIMLHGNRYVVYLFFLLLTADRRYYSFYYKFTMRLKQGLNLSLAKLVTRKKCREISTTSTTRVD